MILAKEFCSTKFRSKVIISSTCIMYFLWKFKIFSNKKTLIIYLIKKINIKIGLM